VSILRSTTDPRWTEVALADLPRTLGDHAHCEKKAAATAMKLVADYAAHPDLVRKMARLAQEETQHFLAVLAEMGRRKLCLPPDLGDPYAQALFRHVRSGPGRLLDRLLVGALIEARSCERLALLGEALPRGRLRDLYRQLATAEGGHERLFVDLAERHCGEKETAARLEALAEAEAKVMAALPVEARIH
jgi:tRNA 2-(methylsulfanyl)-N6-isopentenyladenosine37 hydroxylase